MIQQFKKYFLLFLLAPVFNLAWSQNLTGIWRGYFITEYGDNYKFEIQVKQNGAGVSGVSYSYLTTVFYGKATLSGSFNKAGNVAIIREIKTTELKMSGLSSACIMRCVMEYSKSGNEEFLEGTYTSKHEKDGWGAKKGDDCGGGKVMLRKVTESDFYTEPFLRKKVTPLPPVKKETPKTNKPVATAKPPVTKPATSKPAATKPVTKPNNNPVASKPKTDTATKIAPPIVKKAPPVQVATPTPLKNRTNELVKTLVVHDENVIVKLYDNGEIDDDTISIYLDKKLVLSSKRLTTAPLIVKLKMDEDDAVHELVMVAENLGRIPPNTSLMIVESGDQRFDVRITSTEQKNAMVRFRYEKAKSPSP